MILLIIGICFILLGLIYEIYKIYNLRFENKILTKQKPTNNFAIIIPARDESLVIELLLNSISEQSINVDFSDVYVVVENQQDPTIDLCKK